MWSTFANDKHQITQLKFCHMTIKITMLARQTQYITKDTRGWKSAQTNIYLKAD